jgi:Phosphotransferase enzyme family
MVGVERAPASPVEIEATAVAVAVAAENGLRCEEPLLIGQSSNVLVHLRPAPVVARVMTATAMLHSDERAWLERELSVASFAARAGAPVVAPSDLLAAGPHERDGLWLSFWELASERADGAELSGEDVGRSLRELHRALAGYPHELPLFTDALGEMMPVIDRLAQSGALEAGEAGRFRSELDRLATELAAVDLPWQALHGDVSLTNLLNTDRGARWNDFEDVCRGPLAWDVAGIATSCRRRRSPEFAQQALAAHGSGLSDEEPAPFVEAHELYSAVWDARRRAG